MKTVVVTGAAGRIGRTLVPALADAGYDVRATDRSAGNGIIVADILDPAELERVCEGAFAVVHLAGHPNSRDWETVEALNMRGTRNALEAAVRTRVARFLYASSIHVAGFHPSETAIHDDLELRPDSPYGVSKVLGEALLRYHCERFGLTGFALRICTFEPLPSTARALRTWISPTDLSRLVLACLSANVTGFTPVWGVSRNARAGIDSAVWARVGYDPRDDAEDYAAVLESDGIDTSLVSEWPLLGGRFVRPPEEFWEERG